MAREEKKETSPKDHSSPLDYSSLGASADKSGLHKILSEISTEEKTTVGSNSEENNLFCQVVKDISGDDNYYTFIHADGAGTKGIVSYLWYKETGDPSYFGRLSEDALVMNLDDIFCLGLPDKIILSNAIARNSRLVPDEAIKEIIKGYKTSVNNLRDYGIDIELSGGETADCGDTVRTLLVDATATGRIKKSNIINPKNIKAGDVIVGLSSSGLTTYNSHNNSGIGSNGLTLARHCLISKEYLKKYPEIVDSSLDQNSVYQGDFKIKDTPYPLGTTIGDALSSPTRSYAPVLKTILETHKEKINGIIHLTGGAHGKVLRFIKNLRIIKDSLPTPPPIFNLIRVGGRVQIQEMYRVFNMGVRLEIYTDQSTAEDIIKICSKFGLESWIIGRVENKENSTDNSSSVEISLQEGTFCYKL